MQNTNNPQKNILNEIQPLAKITAKDINPALRIYETLGKKIKKFEDNLDDVHEIGARLVSFGQDVTFHIEHVEYDSGDIICFSGITQNGDRVQLIQHFSQLNVLLIAVQRLEEKARRIGYIWD